MAEATPIGPHGSRVIKAAADLSGDIDKAVFWVSQRTIECIRVQACQVPLVSEGRTDDVLRYVASSKNRVRGESGKTMKP